MRSVLLVVPLLGLAELAAYVHFRGRAPRAEEYAKCAALVDRVRQAEDRIVVAPAWIDPLAREALGDRMPLADLGRADDDGSRFVVELSAFGARAPELDGFREVTRAEAGPFLVRRLEHPSPRPSLYRLLDHVNPEALSVSLRVGEHESPCEFERNAKVSAGGLGGHVTYPRERFRCGGGEAEFVGLVVIDDQQYRPRRCLHARPPGVGALRLTFRAVPLGRALVGHSGASFLLARSHPGSRVEIRARAGDEELGRFSSHDARGFQRFEFSTAERAGTVQDLSFEFTASPARDLDFCFVAETR